MENSFFKKAILISLAIVFGVMFGMWVFSPTEVVVTGTGKVSVPASNVTFNVTLNSANDDSGVALAYLSTKIVEVKRVLSSMGITADNLTETQVTITPAAAIVAGMKGYQAMMTITVKMTNVKTANDVVVSMYKNGATLVSQPVVTVEDETQLEQMALADALKNAKQNLNNTVGFLRPIRKVVAIEQPSSGNVATTTKTMEGRNGEFEVLKAVSVTYRVW